MLLFLAQLILSVPKDKEGENQIDKNRYSMSD